MVRESQNVALPVVPPYSLDPDDNLRRLPGFIYWVYWFFLTICRVARVTKRIRRWHEWQLWHQWAFPIFENSHWLTRSSHGFWMEARPSHLGDLTAAFGRPEERSVVHAVTALNHGGVFVDVGAHVGRYSLLAARTVGRAGSVVAMEPDQANSAILRSNHVRNNLPAQILQVAIGDSDGSVSLLSGTDSMNNTLITDWYRFLHPRDRQSSPQVQIVRMITLDSLLDRLELKAVDLLKIDVEGAELRVLDGARRSLAQRRIRAVICEVHQPSVKLDDVTGCLERFGLLTVSAQHNQLLAKLEESQ